MKALSEREKNLLVLLAVFLLAVGFTVWLLLPALEKQQEYATTLELDQLTWSDIETRLAALDADQAREAELEKSCAQYTADFYPLMQSQEIDRLITSLVLQAGLDARDLTMSGASAPETVAPFYLSDLSESENAALYVSEVSLRAEGTASDLWKLIDLFTNDLPSVRVTEFTWEKGSTVAAEGTDADGNALAGSSSALELTLAVYMTAEG